jgi:protein-L-isoaspartate(D-aspartate) O-methyltransferase
VNAEGAPARQRMVDKQLRRRGIADARLLAAMAGVERHRFVDVEHAEAAYADHPLPIGHGQTISQPFMVALMCELAGGQGEGRVLEIGAGCGYQSAVLARLFARVYAIELVSELAQGAAVTLAELAVDNVVLRTGDGGQGWREEAPFDAIVVAAGARRVPPALLSQLAEGGRLVIPVGPRGLQMLQVHRRQGGEIISEEHTACRFVELRGEHGWT